MNALVDRLAGRRGILSVAAALAVLTLGYIALARDTTGTNAPYPTEIERWEDISPDSTYRLTMRQTKLIGQASQQLLTPSMVPPIHSLRKIVISVDQQCQVTSVADVIDDETGELIYRITTTKERNYAEFFDRAGLSIPEDQRYRELPSKPAEFESAVCGADFTEPADYWAAKVEFMGARRDGTLTFAGDPATRFVLEAPVSPEERERVWSKLKELSNVYQRIVSARTTWVIHDLNGMVLSSATELILDDGSEVFLESFEILESKVEVGS